MTEESIRDLLQFAETVERGLENATFADKRRWFSYLQVKVTVTERVATIACRLPVQPGVIDLHDS